MVGGPSTLACRLTASHECRSSVNRRSPRRLVFLGFIRAVWRPKGVQRRGGLCKCPTLRAEGGRFELPRACALAVFKTAAFSLTRPPLRESSRGCVRKVSAEYQLRARLQTSSTTNCLRLPERAQAAQRASLLAASSAATL